MRRSPGSHRTFIPDLAWTLTLPACREGCCLHPPASCPLPFARESLRDWVLEARECGTKRGLGCAWARPWAGQELFPGGRPPAPQRGLWDLGPLRPAEPPPLWLLLSPLPARRASLEKLPRAKQGGLGPDPPFAWVLEQPPRGPSLSPQTQRQSIVLQPCLCTSSL